MDSLKKSLLEVSFLKRNDWTAHLLELYAHMAAQSYQQGITFLKIHHCLIPTPQTQKGFWNGIIILNCIPDSCLSSLMSKRSNNIKLGTYIVHKVTSFISKWRKQICAKWHGSEGWVGLGKKVKIQGKSAFPPFVVFTEHKKGPFQLSYFFMQSERKFSSQWRKNTSQKRVS